MKKIFTGISILLLSILMVGCGPEFKLDLTKAKENVNALKSKEFSPMEATYYLQESEYFGTLEDIYQLETVGITKENISTTNGQTHYSMAVAEDGTSYFIGLPADGKKEALETELDTYYQDVQDKLLKTEHEGYLIYLVSNNNDEALKIIKDKGYPVLFPALMTVTDEMLESTFGFTKEDVGDIW